MEEKYRTMFSGSCWNLYARRHYYMSRCHKNSNFSQPDFGVAPKRLVWRLRYGYGDITVTPLCVIVRKFGYIFFILFVHFFLPFLVSSFYHYVSSKTKKKKRQVSHSLVSHSQSCFSKLIYYFAVEI